MPKKACCCKCCASYNYTNNVAMLDDLLVDWGNELGVVDGITGSVIGTKKEVKVYPIHPDDELILFQRPGGRGIYGNTKPVEQFRLNGCVCCYGSNTYIPQRTQTVRQKYKNIGCSWTWYPANYVFNADPQIPQCSVSAFQNGYGDEQLASECFSYFLWNQDFYTSDSSDIQKFKCEQCTQIKPWFTEADGPSFTEYGDVIGNPNPPSTETNVDTGWLTQAVTPLYPGYPRTLELNNQSRCCACVGQDPDNVNSILIPKDVSCWTKFPSPQAGACDYLRYSREYYNSWPLRVPNYSKFGALFYSPLQGRIDSVLTPHVFGNNEIFTMGVNTDLGTAYFVNSDLVNLYYQPSKGGYKQNNCTYCSLSPYLRRLAMSSYPWAFDIFCAGGGGPFSPAATLDLGETFIKIGYGDYDLNVNDGLHRESLSLTPTEEMGTKDPFRMELYQSMLGESTFYSQFIGTVHLEHYFHYMGTNLDDVEAAGNTIPAGVGFAGATGGQSPTPKDRWGYWLTRTTPRVFVFKSSGTPLFYFDLVYADRLGIFQAFADPDPNKTETPSGTMTIRKFLSYFSMFGNNIGTTQLPDGRGSNMYPPACGEDGYKYVQVVKDILGAMCEAGIIGTRDHRPNIYKEIRQIIETGMDNGKNGSYYQPWDKGNIIPVTPNDFIKLKAKYWDPYGRMATEQEMFPFNDDPVEALGKLSPIRKVIPPTLIARPDIWTLDPGITQDGPFIMYKEHTFNPDEIFNEMQYPLIWDCSGNSIQGGTFSSAYKIQDLQFSKLYNNDNSYHNDAPDYVNRQLFFRAVPGSWKIIKWGSCCLNAKDCQNCIGTDACSPYNIYGYGPDSSGFGYNLWHAPTIASTYFSSDELFNGIKALCNGINPASDRSTECRDGDISRGQGNGAEQECGYQGICWDPSGAPSTVLCVERCLMSPDGICSQSIAPCGNICGAKCGDHLTGMRGYNFSANQSSTSVKCGDLFGKDCCECIGKSENDYVTGEEWADLLFNKKLCETCGTKCMVGCPDNGEVNSYEVDQPSAVANQNPFRGFFSNNNNGTLSTGPGRNRQPPGCNCELIDTSTCSVLGEGPCDPNCGYNAFESHPLAFVMQQNNYSWGFNHVFNSIECQLCQCSGYNHCYARFGGKVSAYLPDPITGFYSPTESAYLFYTDNYINMDVPLHLIPPKSQIGFEARSLSSCGSCAQDPDSCICLAARREFTWGALLCPGAVTAEYNYGPGPCTPPDQGTCCNEYPLWCRITRGGSVILKPIVYSDINDERYAY